ncbi:TRPA1 [Cordylochernes scorpioides]|uniref:TRPA1 n=1 Tax=Cordylochernes scorpioides TaxID=51811 RepID=A0ABY6LQ08_9ARAC|nr:TRPA1 [Cordylochernes scorpioides]
MDLVLCTEVAEAGNLKEFQKLVDEEPTRLVYRDPHGQTPLHRAASRDHVDIIRFILDRGADPNLTDDEGNTALHVAVENGALAALHCLLERGADGNALNNDMMGPIHLATQLNQVHVLEEMVKHKSEVTPLLRGKHGRTALHIAAIYDHADCARVLLSQLAVCPKVCCDNGYYPIHEAAKNGSANTLKAILDFGMSLGITRECLMMLYDADGNVPLHSAVHAGDIKAVQLCLESGALISTQQHDLSTPVHLACSQGALEIVKLMFEFQPEQKKLCLKIGDAQDMTPLHYAAMFDHRELAQYLIREGANLAARDKEGRTAVLLAAVRGAWDTLSALLSLNPAVTDTDVCNRNLMHHIVLSGGNLETFTNQICQLKHGCKLINMLNERDFLGCTPMHYASRTGHLKTIQSLLRLGAAINLKNNDNQSPLHFAAKYGRYNTVRQLLDNTRGHLIINEMDGEGRTPLHIASQSGHTRVVQLLLVRGALLHRDHRGRTPLHYSAMNGYTHTMEQLLAVHSHLLDQTDREGNSALHLAAANNRASAANLLLTLNCQLARNTRDQTAVDCALFYKHSEVTMAMVTHVTRCDDVMRCKLKLYGCLLEALTATMPDVMMVVLDRGITRSKFSEDSKSYYVRYNFEYLQDMGKICFSQPKNPVPLPVMNLMVRYGREDLMSHPLCVKYLENKWNSYGMYFHLMNLAIYTIFLIFITITSVFMMSGRVLNNSTDHYHVVRHLEAGRISSKTAVVVMAFVVFNVIKEFLQMWQQRGKYLADPINLLEWILYFSAGTLAVSQLHPSHMEPSCAYIAAAVAVFLAWFNYLLYLQRDVTVSQIGLAVGDIETVRRNAQMKRLTMQVEMHTDLERKLPQRLIRMVDKMELLDYPNQRCSRNLVMSTVRRWLSNPREVAKQTPPPMEQQRALEPTEDTDDINFDNCGQSTHVREIKKMMEQQINLLRLVIKKMDIHEENDDFDDMSFSTLERPLTAAHLLSSPNMDIRRSPRPTRQT